MKSINPKIFLYLFLTTPIIVPLITYVICLVFLNNSGLTATDNLFLIITIETFLFLPIIFLFFIEKELIRLKPFLLRVILNSVIYTVIISLLSIYTSNLESSPFFHTLMYSNIVWVLVHYNCFEVLRNKKMFNKN